MTTKPKEKPNARTGAHSDPERLDATTAAALAAAQGVKETPADVTFIAQLNREHMERTADIVRRMDEARERLIIPEPDNPLDMEGPDGIPTTDPKTGRMGMLRKGTAAYRAYLDEHADAIRIHDEWERAEINAEYVALRRELEQAQEDYSRRLIEYYDRIKNAPSISTKPAAEYVAPTDLVSYRVFSGDISGVPENIRISGAGAKKQAITSVSVNFEAIENDSAVSGTKRLDRYTQSVYQAIIALWNAGNTYMTLGMIYSTMTGGKDTKLNTKQADMITDSIRSLMRAAILINASDEHNLKGYGAVKASYYGNLITAKFATVQIKGKRVDGAIQIFSAPILYEYAAAKHQIATGDIALLDAPINKTPENIILIDYLRRRVDAMPSPRTENKIRYAAVYDTLGVSGSDETAKKKKYRIRDYISKTLDYWKQRGYIRDYAEYTKEGRNFAEGVQITPAGALKEIPQEGE